MMQLMKQRKNRLKRKKIAETTNFRVEEISKNKKCSLNISISQSIMINFPKIKVLPMKRNKIIGQQIKKQRKLRNSLTIQLGPPVFILQIILKKEIFNKRFFV